MHKQYESMLTEWQTARDCVAGESVVKRKKEAYLPRMDCQSDTEYAAYLERGTFYGATARLLEDCLAAAFKKTPELDLEGAGAVETILKECLADIDLAGTSWVGLSKLALSETLVLGRVGFLALWCTESARPYILMWPADQIVDWQYEKRGGVPVLVRVELRDNEHLHRQLTLKDGACLFESWEDDQLIQRQILRCGDGPVPIIPFIFHSPASALEGPARLPLGEVISANLDHYRLTADYRHGLHLASLPTAWVSGFDKDTGLRMGSAEAWVTDVPGATAGFLEFQGSGLDHVEKALAGTEQRISDLGNRLLGRGETSHGQAGLAACLSDLGLSLSRVLRLMHAWLAGAEYFRKPAALSFSFPELADETVKGTELSALVDAWKAGAISRDTLLAYLKRGNVLPDGRTIGEEKALIWR